MDGYGHFADVFRQTVGSLRFGTPRRHEGLCVLPLLSAAKCSAQYVLLDEAVSRGALTVTEISEAGSVPYLTAVNRGPWPVLIFDGEELVGAKQNRITNTTILVGVGRSVLPVSCVEQGRWSRRSAVFSAGSYAAHPTLRMEKESLVRKHAAAAPVDMRKRTRLEPQEARAARFIGAQAGVWDEVSRTSACLGVESETSALADSYETCSRDLEDYIRALDFVGDDAPGQTVGVMVFFESRFVCADFLQPAGRFEQLYPKLLRGYALEALVTSNKRDILAQSNVGHVIPPHDPEMAVFDAESAGWQILAELADADLQVQSAVDLGEDLRFERRSVRGSGLAWNQELLQFSLFPREVA